MAHELQFKDYQWLLWGVSKVSAGGLPAATLERLDRDRRLAARLRSVTRRIPLEWIDDRSVDVRFIGHANRLWPGAWRKTAHLTFNGQHADVEGFGANGSGPGFGFTDWRIYLDGALVGRAWSLGCSLGCGGRVGPAVAMLRPDLALRLRDDGGALHLVRRTALPRRPRSPAT